MISARLIEKDGTEHFSILDVLPNKGDWVSFKSEWDDDRWRFEVIEITHHITIGHNSAVIKLGSRSR